MPKQESKFGIKFRHWIMANPTRLTAGYEIKHSRGKKSFPLREWKQAQRDFAESLLYSDKGVLIRTEGVEGLPDYFYVYKKPTFVVIDFPEGFAVISAENLKFYKPKSITLDKAEEIAHDIIRY